MPTFVERRAEQIQGVLSCFDRVVLTGTLPDLCHAEAMARYLESRESGGPKELDRKSGVLSDPPRPKGGASSAVAQKSSG